MNRTVAVVSAEHLPLPRGWIVLGMALSSWALFVAMAAGLNQLFLVLLTGV
ncbi:hypothetical protein [Devosia sp. Root436]|jgi:hypothetical protein|uniref:hypothetical protein n=1 Tax=Devosia sp. Root436 TaxID=1736537 RepID=UPI000B11D50B|nr:hypothetical protein [Devosia sp. Root436]